MKKSIFVIIIFEILLIVLLAWLVYLYAKENFFDNIPRKTETAQNVSGGSFLETVKSYWEEIRQNKNTHKKNSVNANRNPADINERYDEKVEEMAKEITPEREDEFIENALAEMLAQNYSGALKIYDAVIKANPGNGRAWMNRGAAKAGLKDYAGAIADSTRSIEINPAKYAAYLNRGMYYNESALNKHSQEDFYKALDDINTYTEAGEFDERDRNTQEEAYILKGQILARVGRYREAIETLEYIEPKYINEGQKNREFYSWIGWSYQMLGDAEQAKKYYAKAVNAGSEYAKKRLSEL